MNRQQPTHAFAKPYAKPYAKPWVEWCANHIDDPLRRLKFLRSVAPLSVPTAHTRRRFWQFALATALLLAILGSFFLARSATHVKAAAVRSKPVAATPTLAAVTPGQPVWLVDKSAGSETYSDGLRIDTRFESPNQPRTYLAFPAGRIDDVAEDRPGVRLTTPAGIVFHTTESRQLPFEASRNSALKKVGESLIDYVRRKHAYHYLIDRFGRVYRIVPEGDSAEHAGYSVWADDSW